MFFTAKRDTGNDITINVNHIQYVDKLAAGNVSLRMKNGCRFDLDMPYNDFNAMLQNIKMLY